jgi:hypothetical protein
MDEIAKQLPEFKLICLKCFIVTPGEILPLPYLKGTCADCGTERVSVTHVMTALQ